MALITERLEKIEKQESLVSKELQEYLDNETKNAVCELSKYLKSSEVVDQFTSWTLDDLPNSDDRWKVMVTNFIHKTLMKRLKELITAWEDKHHVFADVRTSLIQYFQQRFNVVEGQLRDLESSLLADDAASSEIGPQGGTKLQWAKRVILAAIYYAPKDLAAKMLSVTFDFAFFGTKVAKRELEYWLKTKEFKEDKCTFMAKASKEYLADVAEEQNLRTFVVEQLKEGHVCLKEVVSRIPDLINADKMLFELLRDETRAPEEIERLYKPLCQRSLELRGRMALFCINEVRTINISRTDLEWNEADRSSCLGTGAFGSVYRGKLKQGEEEQPVALKIWKKELNDSDASDFLAETEILR